MRRFSSLLLAVAVAGAGCFEGKLEGPGGGGDDDDSGGADAAPPGADADPGAGADAAALPLGLSGTAMDFGNADPLPDVLITSLGLTPEVIINADATGAYVIEPLPDGATFSLTATLPLGYLATTSATVIMPTPGAPVLMDLYLVSDVYAQRQSATMGLVYQPGSSIIIADLVNGQGLPKEGIPLASITLVNGNGTPVSDGPYFIGALGDVDANVLTSTAYNGHARVAFLNAPPGVLTLRANYGGAGALVTTTVTTVGPSAHLPILKGGMGQ